MAFVIVPVMRSTAGSTTCILAIHSYTSSCTLQHLLCWAHAHTLGPCVRAVCATLQGNPSAIISTIQAKLIKTLLANYALWPLAHIINFKFIPSAQRILYINCVQVCAAPVPYTISHCCRGWSCSCFHLEPALLHNVQRLYASSASVM